MVHVKLRIFGVKFGEIVTVDEDLYKGDIYEFIKHILSKKIPGLTNEKYERIKGKFFLKGKNIDGKTVILNSGIDQEKLNPEEIKNIINDNITLTLTDAPMPSVPEKEGEKGEEGAAFVKGIFKSSITGGKKTKRKTKKKTKRKTKKKIKRKTKKKTKRK